jgi:hypothetical protein
LLGDPRDVVVTATNAKAKMPVKTRLTASMGEPYVDPGPKASMPTQSLEDLATDILTDGARRKLAATGNAVANVARTFAPSLFRSSAAKTRRVTADDGLDVDPLDDDQRALEARFEALEREAKEK